MYVYTIFEFIFVTTFSCWFYIICIYIYIYISVFAHMDVYIYTVDMYTLDVVYARRTTRAI